MSAMTDELSYKAAYCHMRARMAASSEVTRQWTLMATAWIDMARIHRRMGEAHGAPRNLALPDQDWGDGPLVPAQIDPAPEPVEPESSANVLDFRRRGPRD
jgi:hypothetical protein